ncbi:acid phosphatase precursor related protein [Pyrococcus sp. NA2]|uniref:phosphatase PAP2 family protein n=1 Tax=Pyrococcus sp. (strain NA2) TaxID=342949 RepID=UPI000209AFC5|nr:phosphatase PAP2 family protein [Pyrococcus sp. NA2]AEC51166.1 acid phosphatase precursor related protein [Pyrococcus sp. NA2]
MRKLVILGITSFTIGVLEGIGAFNGINTIVNEYAPQGNYIVSALTKLGDTSVVLIIITLTILLKARREKIDIVRPYLSFFLVLATVGVLKVAYGIPRPSSYGSGIASYAFPSGHAAKTSMLANYLGDLWPRFKLVFYIIPLIVGATRILLHVHWFSDVLFGVFYGAFIDEAVKEVIKRWVSSRSYYSH